MDLRYSAVSSLLAFTLVLAGQSAPAGAKEEGRVDKDEASTVVWKHSYAEATKAAKAEDKPLLLKFYTGWCPHCVRMDKTTWKDDEVGKLASSFVAAKVNADVEKVPVKRYGLTGYPTVIVAEPGGEEVFRLEGYKDAGKIKLYLQTYVKHGDEIDAAFAKLKEDRGDPEGLLALGRFYQGVGLAKDAIRCYEKAMKKAEGAAYLEACTGAGTCLVKKKDFKQAVKVLDRAFKRAGDSPGPMLLVAMGRARAGMGESAEARNLFQRVLDEHPESPEAAPARQELGAL